MLDSVASSIRGKWVIKSILSSILYVDFDFILYFLSEGDVMEARLKVGW